MLSRTPNHYTLPFFFLLLSWNPIDGVLLDYSTGFVCNDNVLSLNPGPRAFPRLVENTDDGFCTLRMSPDSLGRTVSAFAAVTLDNDDYAFDTTFTYQFSGLLNGVGDGIAFVMHQDTRGTSALASGGGDLGVYGEGMITPAIVVEIDTCTYMID